MEFDEVMVYDNVFGRDESLEIIHLNDAFKQAGYPKMHCYFDRRITPYKSSVEYLLDDFCKRVGDVSPIVEYWVRLTWMNMECHQDVNEHFNKRDRNLVVPNFGHILYLGEESPEACTLIFSREFDRVTCVMPKVGRVVRFDGDLFHYVPQPFSFIFNGEHNFDRKARSVLLFNTWTEYEHYPLYKSFEPPVENIMRCRDKTDWVTAQKTFFPLERPVMIMVQYMGDEIRRLMKKKVETFYAPGRMREYLTDGRKSVGVYELKRVEVDDTDLCLETIDP